MSRFGPFRERIGSSVMWLDASRRGRLLDVGCGSGQFLANMRDLGWEVMGVEPDPEAARVAREKLGLEVCQGTLAESEFPQDSFDVVTMSHVIEHVPDPLGLLKECKGILKPGGRLVLVTPNIESLGARVFGEFWRGWEPPRHLFLFSPRTLSRCVESAGLQNRVLTTPANGARFMWTESRLLRRDGVLPGGRPPWSPTANVGTPVTPAFIECRQSRSTASRNERDSTTLRASPPGNPRPSAISTRQSARARLIPSTK